MSNAFLKLKELSKRTYGYGKVKSAALLITSEKEYSGIAIYTYEKSAQMTAISNAICNWVSDGRKSFSQLLVYADTMDDTCVCEIIDEETIGLLKEFNITQFHLLLQNGRGYIVSNYFSEGINFSVSMKENFYDENQI